MTEVNGQSETQIQGTYQELFKKRNDVHLARKVWHMSMVFLMFLAWSILPFWISMSLLILGWIAFVPADFIRLKNPDLNTKISNMFKLIMRQNELNKLAGTTYLITGALLVTTLFPHAVVALSLLFLAFADPIASYVGIRYGKDKIFGHKSVQGFIAAFVVCFIASGLYLYYKNVSDYILVISLIAGLIGALAELIPLGKLDDNFSMPVLSCIGLYVVFYLFDVVQFLN